MFLIGVIFWIPPSLAAPLLEQLIFRRVCLIQPPLQINQSSKLHIKVHSSSTLVRSYYEKKDNSLYW